LVVIWVVIGCVIWVVIGSSIIRTVGSPLDWRGTISTASVLSFSSSILGGIEGIENKTEGGGVIEEIVKEREFIVRFYLYPFLIFNQIVI
jgi:hypothetical protein